MIWDTWTSRWQEALEACSRLGGDVCELIIRQPASEAEVAAVEQELGVALPTSFRQVLIQFSSAVDLGWYLPTDFALPAPLREIFSGECYWDLSRIVDMERRRQLWIKDVFSFSDDPYNQVWHNVLAFRKIANGDMLAFDLSSPTQPVIYLSHDGGEGHGYQLGADFADFIDRLTRLGCPGSEDWQMMPFLASPTSFLDPDCENARLWRSVFGLNIPK